MSVNPKCRVKELHVLDMECDVTGSTPQCGSGLMEGQFNGIWVWMSPCGYGDQQGPVGG